MRLHDIYERLFDISNHDSSMNDANNFVDYDHFMNYNSVLRRLAHNYMERLN